jgi:Ca-activated chloride channel family protein
MRLTRLARLFAALLAVLVLSACRDSSPSGEPFRILSGSENRTLKPLIKDFAKKQGVPVEMSYRGSVAIMLELNQGTATTFDAV